MQTRNTSKKHNHMAPKLGQVGFEVLFEHSTSGGSPNSKRNFVPQFWSILAKWSESIKDVLVKY